MPFCGSSSIHDVTVPSAIEDVASSMDPIKRKHRNMCQYIQNLNDQ